MPARRPRRATLAVAMTLALGAAGLVATPVAATNVATFAEFLAAWQNADESLITLTTNITIECGKGGEANVERSASLNIVVDGAGFTLHNPCTGDALDQTGTGDVTLRNLRLTGTAISGDGIEADGNVIAEQSTIVMQHGEQGINADGTVTLSFASIRENGEEGVNADGSVTATDSTVALNGLAGDDGISADGDVTLTRSTVSGNGGIEGGDGVEGTTVTVTASTIDGNGEHGVDATVASLTNSTVADNGLAGVFADDSITATHSTITGNVVNLENLVIDTIHLFGSVVADADQANCIALSIEDLGFNHVDDDTCGPIAPATEPHGLGPLASNGGPTRTRLPGAGSPLIDAIPSAQCGAAGEQRGIVSRPQGAGCEIGSVEVVVTGPASPSPTTPASPAASQLPDTGTALSGAGSGTAPVAAVLALVLLAALAALAWRRVAAT
jgi:hypothetical protein